MGNILTEIDLFC